MNKKLFFGIAFILNTLLINAQTPNWAWAKGVGGNIGNTLQVSGNTSGNNVVTDGNGDVYVIGYFQTPTMVVGNYTLTNTNNSGNSADIFIAKYDAVGNILWAKSAQGDSSDNGLGIATDAANNVYVTGEFSSTTINFDSKTLTNTNTGTDDIFIVKYSSAGNVIWAKNYGGSKDDFGNAITTDAMSNIYISGSFKSPTLNIGAYILTYDSTLYSDMFIAKYDSSGNVLFAKSIGKSCSIAYIGSNIITDANNNVYVTGSFSNAKTTIGNDTLINKGNQDIFIAKYNSLGIPLWAKSAGGTSTDEANSMAIDGNGDVYITGYFASAPLIISSYTLTPIVDFSVFTIKYGASGNVIWAKSLDALQPNSAVYAPCIATANNSIYIAGGFINTNSNNFQFIFGSDTLDNATSTDAIFIVKYDLLGNEIWGKDAGGNWKWDQAYGITTDKYGNVYTVGGYDDRSIAFGSDTLINVNTNQWTSNYFIAKIGTTGVGIEQFNQINTINIYPNPSNGNINISNNIDIDNIKITNMLGQTIYEAKSNTTNTTLKIDNGGIYFITVTTGKEITTKKVIVNK